MSTSFEPRFHSHCVNRRHSLKCTQRSVNIHFFRFIRKTNRSYDLKPCRYIITNYLCTFVLWLLISQCCYFLFDSICRRLNEEYQMRSKCTLIALLSLCKCRSKQSTNHLIRPWHYCSVWFNSYTLRTVLLENMYFPENHCIIFQTTL